MRHEEILRAAETAALASMLAAALRGTRRHSNQLLVTRGLLAELAEAELTDRDLPVGYDWSRAVRSALSVYRRASTGIAACEAECRNIAVKAIAGGLSLSEIYTKATALIGEVA